ncbi:ribosome small subunit-dependent GTPase A [Clostridium sp.]|uniref:ribosome small subunit-dependent GTPase A n=1 Tax=Clostridium sp. TaxID=1506 RepID=UPI00346474E1
MSLEKLGWDIYFKNNFRPYLEKDFYAGRVISQHKGNYVVYSEDGILKGKLSGRFMHNADVKKDYPTVGDWVVIKTINDKEVIIHDILPRKSYFSRKLTISGGRKVRNGIVVGGHIEEQIIGSNIDTAFIVIGADDNFNVQRIERYITLVRSSKVLPVILLNKCDLCKDIPQYIKSIEAIAHDIDIHAISVLDKINMNIFRQYLCLGKTLVFLGSSGVGKSSIINYLFGDERQRTNSVSDSNKKGKHTTTSPQLFLHQSGCMLIDTPGLRELQLWADEDILEESFKDIYSLIEKCKYRDCAHEKEPGCAIKAAIESGELSIKRFESYKSQLKELKVLQENRSSYYSNRKSKYTKKI